MSPQTRLSRKWINHASIFYARAMIPLARGQGLRIRAILLHIFNSALVQSLFRNRIDLLMAHEKDAYTHSRGTNTLITLTPDLPPFSSLPFSMCLPMPLRSPPPVPDIIRPHRRNPQTDKVHLPSLRLQFLRFRATDFALVELPLARVVRLCGLIDVVCRSEGGDAGETCVKYVLWGWLRLRILLSAVVVVVV